MEGKVKYESIINSVTNTSIVAIRVWTKCIKSNANKRIFFVVIPVVIYTLSYIPFSDGTDRGLIERMLNAQQTMFNYHTQLTDDHYFSSKWYLLLISRFP